MGRTEYQVSRAGFVADVGSIDRNNGRQIDWSQVPATYMNGTEHTIKVNDATVAEGDTSFTVDALPVDLPKGTMLDFGTHSVDNVKMLAKLSQAAEEGDTTLNVEALGHAIEDDAEATYIEGGTGDKKIVAGTIMAELSSGKLVPRKDRPGAETATCILATDAVENSREDALTGYGCIVGGVIYQNLLPEDGDAFFNTAIGELETAGVGTGWTWETYADTRAS